MIGMKKRVAAAQATLDRYKDKKFRFGSNDCAQMVRSHVRRMGVPVKLAAKAGTYHSLAGGQKALRKLGFESLIEMMDAHFEQFPPAAALPGDVGAMPGLEGPGALTVALGNGRRKRIEHRRLTGAGTAGDQDVELSLDARTEEVA